MTDLREKLAFIMWHQEAKRSAPNVANRRTEESFRDEGDKTRDVWLGHADAIIAALQGMVKPLEWEENRDDDSVVCRAEAMHRYVAGTDTNGDSYLGIGAAGYTEFGKGGLEAAKAFAEEHHRSAAVSAIMAALGVEGK